METILLKHQRWANIRYEDLHFARLNFFKIFAGKLNVETRRTSHLIGGDSNEYISAVYNRCEKLLDFFIRKQEKM